MILKKAKQIQKLTAAFLLLGMLCINAAKLTHTHAVSASKTHLHGFSNTTSDIKCLICDYELTKEGDLSFASFEISTLLFYTPQNTQAFSFTPLQVFSSFENRGPPAIA